MRRDRWKLNLVNAVVLIQNSLEVMLPVEGNHRHSIFVQKQETCVAVDDWFLLGRLSAGNDPAKALHDLLAHRHIPFAAFGLGVLDDVLHIPLALKLVVYPDALFLKVNIRDGQSAKFGNPKSRVEQDEDTVIVFAVAVVLLNELEERPLLRSGNQNAERRKPELRFRKFRLFLDAPNEHCSIFTR